MRGNNTRSHVRAGPLHPAEGVMPRAVVWLDGRAAREALAERGVGGPAADARPGRALDGFVIHQVGADLQDEVADGIPHCDVVDAGGSSRAPCRADAGGSREVTCAQWREERAEHVGGERGRGRRRGRGGRRAGTVYPAWPEGDTHRHRNRGTPTDTPRQQHTPETYSHGIDGFAAIPCKRGEPQWPSSKSQPMS